MSHAPNELPSGCGSVSVWVRRLPAGDEQAQSQLLNRYRASVVRYADYRLIQLGVRVQDAEDIAQEVFLGLFRRAKTGNLSTLDNRDDLWLKLRRITGDRVKDARRKRLPFTESAAGIHGDDLGQREFFELASEDADEALSLVEHALIRRQLAERQSDLPEIASLKMQGFSVQEIADQLKVPKRTIERRLNWINEICDSYANR